LYIWLKKKKEEDNNANKKKTTKTKKRTHSIILEEGDKVDEKLLIENDSIALKDTIDINLYSAKYQKVDVYIRVVDIEELVALQKCKKKNY